MVLEFTLMKPRTKKEKERDKVGAYLKHEIRELVSKHIKGLWSRADTMSGYDLDGYECEDPEELITCIQFFIEGNFHWKRKPVIDSHT